MILKYKIMELNKKEKNVSSKKNKLLEIFVVIHNENFKNKVNIEYFGNIFLNENYKTFIIFERNKNRFFQISGYIIYLDNFDSLDLFEISILKNEQGKGLGRLLLEESIKILYTKKKNFNKNKIFLEVNEKNKIAIDLYKKVGFLEISTRKNYYGKNENGLVMLKEIS